MYYYLVQLVKLPSLNYIRISIHIIVIAYHMSTFPLTISVLLFFSYFAGVRSETKVLCYHSNKNHAPHHIKCQVTGEFIFIHKAYYGYSENHTEINDWTAVCPYSDSDCTTPFDPNLCHLSSECSFLPDLAKKQISNCAQMDSIVYSNYIYVNYSCMPG